MSSKFRSQFAVVGAVLLSVVSAAAAQDATTGPSDPTPPAPGAPPPASGQDTTTSDGFRVGDFTFKPGGRVKLDVIRDFNPIGNEDAFDTRTIFIDGSEFTRSNIHAKETRLSLDIRGSVEGHELRMYVETDFYGTSSALRLRHAYGTWNGLLAGQTWSTFVDEDNFPRTIDFESPTAFASIRQALVRYTHKFGERITWAGAVEDNKSAIIAPAIPGEPEFPFPDLVTRVRFDFGGGHVTTAGFYGAARFRPDERDALDEDTLTLWGWMLSANVTTYGRDTAYGVFTTGEGIGRYRAGITAVPNENNLLHPVSGIAFMGGYEHFWAERWSSNVVYSEAQIDDEAFYTADVNKQLDYGAVNLIWWFLGDRAWMGVEYLYGAREVFGPGTPKGHANRVQYAIRFNLP
jgi:hypothetical protein